MGFADAGVFLRPSSSVPASSSVFLCCAPRPNIATGKSWGRSPKLPRSPSILGAGVFLPLSSEFRKPLPRFILGNPRRAAQRCKPLIARQVTEAPTGLRHHGRRRLPIATLRRLRHHGRILGPPFAFHFPFTPPQRPTLRPMNRGAGSQNATWGPGSKGGKSLPSPSFRHTQLPRSISPKLRPAGPRRAS